jgi:ssDNA-binding Zn-finger/Zn-ribbon topoisomerase 1
MVYEIKIKCPYCKKASFLQLKKNQFNKRLNDIRCCHCNKLFSLNPIEKPLEEEHNGLISVLKGIGIIVAIMFIFIYYAERVGLTIEDVKEFIGFSNKIQEDKTHAQNPIVPKEETSQETYNSLYCNKIDPYDLNVREAASAAVRNHPGEFNLDKLLDIYDWVKVNVIYLNAPLDKNAPYPPAETLATMSGDCKNQAVLIASMIESIGGNARVILQPSCHHAYAIVHFAPANVDMQSYTNIIGEHYGRDLTMHYKIYQNGNWVIFDPAGGQYPGDTLPECLGLENNYIIESCVSQTS